MYTSTTFSSSSTLTLVTSNQQRQHATTSFHTNNQNKPEARLNHTTGLPLRNTTPYGRHSNDWLFGSVEVHKSIAKRLKRAIPHRPSADPGHSV